MQCSNASKELRETRTWGLVSQKKKKKKKKRKKEEHGDEISWFSFSKKKRFHGFQC